MKRMYALIIPLVCLFGCSKPNYRVAAIEYLKTKLVNPLSLDTIKFIKPDSIYTTFYDTKEFYHLRYLRDSLLTDSNLKEAAKISAALQYSIKTYRKKIVGWDVLLIYKAKNKAGIVKTDTCRFTFNSNLNTVKDLYGLNMDLAKR